MLLTQILKDNAQKYPHRIATKMQIGFRQVSFSYQEIYTLAQKVATLLEQNGVKSGDPVLICAPNSPFWTIVFWGCLLKGAIVVPLNIQSTKDIINLIIKQTEAQIIFSFSAQPLKFENLKTFHTDFLDEILAEIPIKFTEACVPDSHLVQIMYTSGTTGEPKGVMLSHQNISSNIWAINQIIKPDADRDRMLSILPLSHIYEQTIGFLLPYSYQVPVIYTHSVSAIRKLMQENQVTKLLAVPEFLQLFMAKIEAGIKERNQEIWFNRLIKLSETINQKWFSRLLFYKVLKQFGGKLDTIASGGAPLDPDLERKWNALGITILQGYGLTETSPTITTNTYIEHRFGSVGKPLSNVQIRLDETGQIWTKGPNVFVGYYKNPTKTAEVLIEGWFNTEDIGQFDQDGFLFIKGRKKYMIIGPGGQNVYPEDIEVELNKIKFVKDSCVIGLEENGSTKIHAVLILQDNLPANFNPEAIVTTANEILTSYQHINSWSIWPDEDFPRTAIRKVKKTEVAKYVQDHLGKNSTKGHAQTNYSKLIHILAHLTGTSPEQIKPETKLIRELNLDSLARVELVNTLEEELRVTIYEKEINTNTTVADLEELIKTQKPVPEPKPLRTWPRQIWAKAIRYTVQAMLFLFTRIFIRLKIQGLENLKEIQHTVIFMPNHTSYLDGIVFAMALPWHLRKHLAFAAARDVLYEEFKSISWLGELIFNTFPIQRANDYNVRLGLEFIGKMLDHNCYVVLFPEGHISSTGELQSAKQGAGLIATQMLCPIVPVMISGLPKIVGPDQFLPRRRGTVTVTFGKPIQFKRSDSYLGASERIEQELKKLE
jgi:long-chain acyl-CoA synthetase